MGGGDSVEIAALLFSGDANPKRCCIDSAGDVW